ncbi:MULTISPECIES: hypothetical protein [Streptomyces]|uniref:Uncharacterized protein n=1 Tax=Streptomyces clavifer TaxID=68188 RepID=A0ABS4VJG7_9ACTN|nr:MULTISPECIES: hypothetical protein [Streptomyces]KQZ19986.1 hypothetical protein ASD51_26110 [Streptomyces sp. Root55]MBP2363941.1 hypothetical protein [Streptomyces clavifer]MDX2744622.1 hypothetical protein [Streptomyces sp. NRRL_B-2557]MDX3063549.1 hypothetical protein [Streptomyces sp. ND04-05B]WRY85904.1 hypothetical protein OG388_34060 [Streptomyces clavifer]
MLSHRREHDVLVLTVREDPGINGRAELATRIMDFTQAYQPSPVLVVINDGAASPATASAVLRAHRQCSDLNVLFSVATHDAPVRRLLEDNADSRGARLVVHPRVDVALESAYAAAA